MRLECSWSKLLRIGTSFSLCPPGRTISGENSRTPLPLLFVALKAFQKLCDSPPSFAGLVGPRCVSLHTRSGASHCSQSTPCLPPSDWWRMACLPWCLYPTGGLTAGCVHIAVYTTYHSFIWLVEANRIQIMCTLLWKFISNNRPIKGIKIMNSI